jgi:hypothetical protein
VVATLGAIALIAAVGGVLLVLFTGKEPPQILVAFGSAAIAALAGLLKPSPRA